MKQTRIIKAETGGITNKQFLLTALDHAEIYLTRPSYWTPNRHVLVRMTAEIIRNKKKARRK